MTDAPKGGLEAAVAGLIAEHEAATAWAGELARELATAKARAATLAESIAAAARLLPEDRRAAARAALTPALQPAPGTRAAALAEFLRTREDSFTPTDLAESLRAAGHPVRAPRDAARMLSRAMKRGMVRREGRGRYRAVI